MLFDQEHAMVPGYWHEAFHHLLINFNVDEDTDKNINHLE